MPVWAVTGKLGAGKSLVAVSRIQKYLNANRRVATNLDLYLENLINPWSKNATVYRLPDVPSVDDFKAIGLGYDGPFRGDAHNGLLVLDECAKWLNSRNWNDPRRKELVDFFVHLRKKRWDLCLIIQDIEALDKQFRDLYCEHIVYCSRSDRYKIPFIGPVFKLIFGEKLPVPRVHIGNVFYQVGAGKQTHVENWIYRGTDIMNAYDTEQGFSEFTSPGLYQFLPPFLVKGRYVSKIEHLKSKLKNVKLWHFFLLGILSGGFAVYAYQPDGNEPDRGLFICNADWELLFGGCDLTKAQVKRMVEDYRKGKVTTAKPQQTSTATLEEQQPHPLQGIYITGSVGYGGNKYDYSFAKDGSPIEPWTFGYKVYDISDCTAYAVNLEDKQDRYKITCQSGESF